jgi:hypothetical protein
MNYRAGLQPLKILECGNPGRWHPSEQRTLAGESAFALGWYMAAPLVLSNGGHRMVFL